MSSNQCIIPECYIDSCLIEVLLSAGKHHVNHQKGNGTVAREMKTSFEDAFCVGIIDEDRKKIDYLDEFEVVNENVRLRLLRHRRNHHYIIQLRPVIETWILDICKEAEIELKDLPCTMNQLKKVTKSVTSKYDVRFIRLFKLMLEKKINTVMQLKMWIEYLKAKTYQAEIKELRNA